MLKSLKNSGFVVKAVFAVTFMSALLFLASGISIFYFSVDEIILNFSASICASLVFALFGFLVFKRDDISL